MQLDRHSPTANGRGASAAALTRGTRPFSASTRPGGLRCCADERHSAVLDKHLDVRTDREAMLGEPPPGHAKVRDDCFRHHPARYAAAPELQHIRRPRRPGLQLNCASCGHCNLFPPAATARTTQRWMTAESFKDMRTHF